jgi:uncharacterized protein (DUF2147 family)
MIRYVVALLAFTSVAQARPATPAGTWLTEDQRGVIAIAPCGNGLCGRIVGMADAASDGKPSVDFQGRPQCGLEIIHKLTPGDPGEWRGTITNPENGKNYGARLTMDPSGGLRLRGFLQVPLVGSALGSTQLWTPYTGTVTPDCRMVPR